MGSNFVTTCVRFVPDHLIESCTVTLAGMCAPPRGKKGCPAPQKLTKPAGRNGAKLTVDCTDYAHTFGLRMEKKMK